MAHLCHCFVLLEIVYFIRGGILVSNDDIRQIIDNYIRGRNAERNREILKRRIIDGVTIEKLSEEFDMSVSQIKEIIFKNKTALKDRLP